MSSVFVESFDAFCGLEGMVDESCIGMLDMVGRVDRLDIDNLFGEGVLPVWEMVS